MSSDGAPCQQLQGDGRLTGVALHDEDKFEVQHDRLHVGLLGPPPMSLSGANADLP